MRKAQVLIVENEAIISMDLRYKLESLGYGVAAEIRSGEEAIDAASRLRPDLVLMDIGLSGDMDGTEAAEEIRRRFNIPVVFLTGIIESDTMGRAKTTEPTRHIHKPIYEAELQAVIEVAIQINEFCT